MISTEEIKAMSTGEIEARLSALRAERILVSTNAGTHDLPAETHTWHRYACVPDGTYVDNPRALARDQGNTRVFPRAWERVRELRAEYLALASERARRARSL